MGTIYLAPTDNYIQKTLNGAITNNATTITLSSTTKLQAPGVVVIDRVDSSGNLTSSLREVVAYTGISGNNITGCTRGFDNSTAQIHADGAVVETMPTVGMWNNLATIVSAGFDGNGLLNAINSPVSIAFTQLAQAVIASIASIANYRGNSFVLSSGASINQLNIGTLLSVSGASIVGFPGVRRLQVVANNLISIASTANFTLIQSLGLTDAFITGLGKVTFNFSFNGPFSATNNFQFKVNNDVAYTEVATPSSSGIIPMSYTFLTTLASGATIAVNWNGNGTFNKPGQSNSFLVAEQ